MGQMPGEVAPNLNENHSFPPAQRTTAAGIPTQPGVSNASAWAAAVCRSGRLWTGYGAVTATAGARPRGGVGSAQAAHRWAGGPDHQPQWTARDADPEFQPAALAAPEHSGVRLNLASFFGKFFLRFPEDQFRAR